MHDDWEPPSLGVERIDVEHRQLFRRVLGLAAAAEQGRTAEVRGALRVLGDSLAGFWRDEEAWMAEQGYPAALEHGRLHAELLARLADARRRDGATQAQAAAAAADVVLSLELHMRTEDLKLGRFFAARENFRALADGKGGKGPALTPIPSVLAALGPLRTPLPGRTPIPGVPSRTLSPTTPGAAAPLGGPGKKPR